MKNKDLTNEIKELHSQVENLLSEDYTNEEIIELLQKQGLAPYYIETIIANIQDDESNKQNFRNSMTMGCFYIVAGLAVNFFSYKIAQNFGSSIFFLFWGIVVLGIVTITRGFILYK